MHHLKKYKVMKAKPRCKTKSIQYASDNDIGHHASWLWRSRIDPYQVASAADKLHNDLLGPSKRLQRALISEYSVFNGKTKCVRPRARPPAACVSHIPASSIRMVFGHCALADVVCVFWFTGCRKQVLKYWLQVYRKFEVPGLVTDYDLFTKMSMTGKEREILLEVRDAVRSYVVPGDGLVEGLSGGGRLPQYLG